MRLYDPTASGPQRTLFRAPAIASLQGKTMGVLENGKLNAPEMLREVAALFEARHGLHAAHRLFQVQRQRSGTRGHPRPGRRGSGFSDHRAWRLRLLLDVQFA